jgi:hypothetical protein|tara:strand:- start:369 stop:482 length:114 start_codon:yes stop_codon:yes gene_type:complete
MTKKEKIIDGLCAIFLFSGLYISYSFAAWLDLNYAWL